MTKESKKTEKRFRARPCAMVGGDGDAFSGLSEDERNAMARISGGADDRPSDRGMSVDDSVALKEQNSKLKEERDSLKGKLQKAEKDRTEAESKCKVAKKDLETANKNLVTARGRIGQLEEELESKKDDYRALKAERDRFEEKVKALESGRPNPIVQYNENALNDLRGQIDELKKERAGLEGRIGSLEDEIKTLTGERDGFKADAEGLKGELDELKLRMETERESVAVVREDERTLSSTRFEDGNYDVRLGADLSYMTFRRDPEGKALSWNGRMSLPKLKAYIPFEKRTRYDGEEIDGMIRIDFVRHGREDSGRSGTRSAPGRRCSATSRPQVAERQSSSRMGGGAPSRAFG